MKRKMTERTRLALLRRKMVRLSVLEKTKEPVRKFKCSICDDAVEGFGCNPAPVSDGRCCDACNWTIVIPTRLRRHAVAVREAEVLRSSAAA
jgi:hypothetical protein